MKREVYSVSIVHLCLYRNIIKFSRGNNYIDTDGMLFAMRKSIFHTTSRIIYRIIMKEMEERGFVKWVSKTKYFIIKNKKNLKMIENLNENFFPLSY